MSSNPYESPTTGAADRSVASRPSWFTLIMVISAIVAVTLTLPLVGWGADEPFFGDFKLSDALVMLVGGGIGTAFWCVWSITTVFAVSQRWWNPAVLIVQ